MMNLHERSTTLSLLHLLLHWRSGVAIVRLETDAYLYTGAAALLILHLVQIHETL